MTDTELSDAIVAYLQMENAASPRTDDEAVRAVAVATDPDDLLARVKALVAESLSIEVDWNSLSLADGGRAMAAEMARRHPELDQVALDALAWKFTFDWR